MEKKYLIKFSDNWADEMDIDSFVLMDQEWKDEYFNRLKNDFEERLKEKDYFCLNFGSNQGIEYEKFDELMRCFTVIEISQEEYDTIEKLFGKSYGITSWLYY